MNVFRHFFILFCFLLLSCSQYLFGQTANEAAAMINKQDFAGAYNRIISDSNYQSDAYLQYLLGLCYLFSDVSRSSALPAFSIAYDALENRGDTRIPGEVYYYIGISKHHKYDFVAAMNHFSEYKAFHEKFYGTANQPRFDHAELMEKLCKNAVGIIENYHLRNTVVHPLNFPLNSSYKDYYPVLPSKSNQLMYASNRPTGFKVVNFGQEVVFLEKEHAPGVNNMFYGLKEDLAWEVQTNSLNFGKAFIAPVSFSSDGQTLLLLMGDTEANAKLYLANQKNNKWLQPELLPSNINLLGSNIKGGAMVANGNRIYFSSNRPGGFGGYDLYVSHFIGNGRWTDPENLGSPINTSGNEITPFVSANMETLYFSSDQHETIGYYDVFVSTKSGTAWLKPENLGYPINSTYDDICYTRSADGVKEMLSSDREIFMNKDAVQKEAGEFATEDNSNRNVFSHGNFDIYEITRFKEKMPLCIVSGNITIERDGQKVPFFMKVKQTSENLYQPFVFEPSEIDEKYFMVLRGKNTYAMNLIYCYDSVKVKNPMNNFVNMPLYDTLYDFQFTVPKNTYHYEFNAAIELTTSTAFGKPIATHIKASSTNFGTTPVDNVTLEKTLEEVRLDALVLIMDRVTALGKKEVFNELSSIEDKIEYIQNSQAFETDPLLDNLVNNVGFAFEKADISYLVGLTEVMRHKDGLNVKPESVTLLETSENIFNRRNKLNDRSKKSVEAIVDWVKDERDANVEFIYFGEPTDIKAQERIEELRRMFKRLGLKDAEKASGYIDSNYTINEQGKVKFIIQRKPK